MNAKLKTFSLGFVFLLILVSGCATPSSQSLGDIVSKPVIGLQPGGPHSGLWKTFDINIDYGYKFSGDIFSITGFATLSDFYVMKYSRLNDLQVYLLFLDGNSRVLESNLLARDLSGKINTKLELNKSFKAPAGSVNISFEYNIHPQPTRE
jgi:hypothetical protein